jgi:hypothetical protein
VDPTSSGPRGLAAPRELLLSWLEDGASPPNPAARSPNNEGLRCEAAGRANSRKKTGEPLGKSRGTDHEKQLPWCCHNSACGDRPFRPSQGEATAPAGCVVRHGALASSAATAWPKSPTLSLSRHHVEGQGPRASFAGQPAQGPGWRGSRPVPRHRGHRVRKGAVLFRLPPVTELFILTNTRTILLFREPPAGGQHCEAQKVPAS